MQKYYRYPWSEQKVNTLVEWWPHFGTYGMEHILGISRKQIKAKVNKLKLVILPKNKRLCFVCKKDFQFSRYTGIKCKRCHLLNRKDKRRTQYRPKERWMQEVLNTVKHRSIEPCDLTLEFLIDLWNSQSGLCYYSGIKMNEPQYGTGRNLYNASLDRIDSSRGYTKNNVVWCCWCCNCGKQSFSQQEYIDLCTKVIKHQQARQECLHGTECLNHQSC